MATWIDAVVVTAMYLLGGGGLLAFLIQQTRPPRLRVAGVLPGLDPTQLTTDSDHEGLI